ncbi:MAG: glycosyltransferase family 2 protein [Burkholderiaceae bacterium]
MNTPKVVIGLPIYNSQKYLEAAIDSILGQSFEDFELAISDNGSTDATQSICERYAVADRRVRYWRSPENRGILWNHRRVLEAISSAGQYFRWAGGDDVMGSGLLQSMVAILDDDPEVFSVTPDTRNIDDDGTDIGPMPRTLDFRSTSARQRAREALLADYQHVMAYGLMRAGPLLKMRTGPHYPGWDAVFLWELVLRGKVYQTDGSVLYRRFHSGSISRVKSLKEKRKWVEPTATKGMAFPHWLWARERYRVLFACPLTGADRWHIALLLTRFTLWQRSALVSELLSVARRQLRSSNA